MRTFALRLIGFVICAGVSSGAADLDREIVLAPQSGSAVEDREIGRWQDAARGVRATEENWLRLASAYVAKARRTLDAGYYKLAEKTVTVAEGQFGASAESRLIRGHVLHNLHRFAEAEAIARRLVAERAAPADFALLSDALMEQGKLAGAIAAVQQLLNLKPGVEAYTRVAQLRWWKGDLPGAVAAMELALAANAPGDTEARGWMLARLSAFALQAGEVGRARTRADEANAQLGDFAPALLARGRALLAVHDLGGAIAALERAAALNPLPEYEWWLADALRLAGDGQKAGAVEDRLRRRGAAADPRTFALFLATRGENSGLAVRLAADELRQRGDGLTHDAYAWALLASGDPAAADAEMHAALAEHTGDPRLALHAGEIAHCRGRLAEAAAFFADAARGAAALTPSEQALVRRRLAPSEPFLSHNP